MRSTVARRLSILASFYKCPADCVGRDGTHDASAVQMSRLA